MCVNMCTLHGACAVSSVDYSVCIYSVSVRSVTASSRGACPRHAVAFQPGTDGDVTLKVTATSALDGDPCGLGPDGRGTDDNARYLHQVGHVVRLSGGGEEEEGDRRREETHRQATVQELLAHTVAVSIGVHSGTQM